MIQIARNKLKKYSSSGKRLNSLTSTTTRLRPRQKDAQDDGKSAHSFDRYMRAKSAHCLEMSVGNIDQVSIKLDSVKGEVCVNSFAGVTRRPLNKLRIKRQYI